MRKSFYNIITCRGSRLNSRILLYSSLNFGVGNFHPLVVCKWPHCTLKLRGGGTQTFLEIDQRFVFPMRIWNTLSLQIQELVPNVFFIIAKMRFRPRTRCRDDFLNYAICPSFENRHFAFQRGVFRSVFIDKAI